VVAADLLPKRSDIANRNPVRFARDDAVARHSGYPCFRSFSLEGGERFVGGHVTISSGNQEPPMCRNIKVLANFEPPATNDEVRASALQFVRKLSGTTKPSKANEEAFNRAVDEVTESARRLIDSLEIKAPPRDRDEEARKAKERSAKRFAS
jgi:hypothetical protein